MALRSRGAEYRARVILRRVMGMEPEEAVERGLRRLMWVMPRQEAVETYLALHPAVDRRLVERLAEKLGGQENTI